MAKTFKRILFFFVGFLFCQSVFAGVNVTEVIFYNLSLKIPQDWTFQKETMKNGDFSLKCSKDNSENFIEIICLRKVIDPVVRANDIASKRSLQEHFEYMQIDEIQNASLKKQKAKLLCYTNTFLNDVSKGGVYSFIFEGYTYTLEYFYSDNPKERKEIEAIIKTYKLSPAEKVRNIVDLSGDNQDKSWKNYDDTTSLETKIKEYGDDLLMINTANNFKKVGNYSSEELSLIDKLKDLQEKEYSLQDGLEKAKEDENKKLTKKFEKQLKALNSEKKSVQDRLEKVHKENLEIKLKE
ncbi:MAG: hypothetical protein IJ748_01990 [Bacteroidales bacterium]|nr:hypothetical protein [Bacteroidales bacterium]